MKKRRHQTSFHEPSLVPLADMLTNTVGILIFIMIFTVLVAAAALIPKRFPMEHTSEKKPLFFVCKDNKIIVLDLSAILKIYKPIGSPKSYDEIEPWLKRCERFKHEDSQLSYSCEANAYYSSSGATIRMAAAFSIKSGKGEGQDDLQLSRSDYKRSLNENSSAETFAFFFIYPNSLQIFSNARKIAIESNFGIGWSPVAQNEPLRFALIANESDVIRPWVLTP